VFDEPSWWYRADPAWQAQTLTPVAAIYGRIAAARLARASGFDPAIPVICIGNFTAGGTGKTPWVARCVAMLAAEGQHAAVLSRGYGGKIASPHWVDAATDQSADVGDEPLLLARAAPVLVARDRAAGAKAVVDDPRGFKVIVMDDGLQNPSVGKRLRIAVVDGVRGFGNGRVIPAGPLRAPLAAQFAVTDAIVVNRGSDGEAPPTVERLRDSFAGPVIEASVVPAGETAWLRTAPLLAYAGIGVPERFFGLLEQLGGLIVSRRQFADHHAFTAAEARALLAEARRRGAQLVTTAKDYVRLSKSDAALAELAAATKVLDIEMVFEPRDEERLRSLLAAALTGPATAASAPGAEDSGASPPAR
jgi:tetraacyldisaccharide 4'-kinase